MFDTMHTGSIALAGEKLLLWTTLEPIITTANLHRDYFMTQVCCTCRIEKPAADFANDKTKKTGKHSKCKSCVKAYKQANRDIISAQRKEYKLRNKAEISAYMIKYRLAYREKNREKLITDSKLWAFKNKERRKQICRKYRQANPDADRAILHRRRARIAGSGGTHTKNDILRIYQLQKGKCACCKVSVGKKYHLDHVIPISVGGTNEKDNLQILCPTCNMIKGARNPVDFMQSMGYLC